MNIQQQEWLKYLKIVTKISISVLLVVVLVYKVGWENLVTQFRAVNPTLLTASVLIILVSNVLQAWQWRILLAAQDIHLPWSQVIVVYFAGIFFNNFLPANIGGEILKIYDVGRKTGNRRAVFAATFFDRLMGMLVLGALAVLFSFFALHISELDAVFLMVGGFFLLIMGGTFALLNQRSSQFMVDLFNFLTRHIVARQIQAIRDAIFLYNDKIVLLRWLGLLSLVIQFLRIIVHYVIALALGITNISLIYFLIFIPILGVLMLMPISISGFGVREWAGMLLFASVGVPAAQAVSIEFIAGVANLVAALLGGIVFLVKND